RDTLVYPPRQLTGRRLTVVVNPLDSWGGRLPVLSRGVFNGSASTRTPESGEVQNACHPRGHLVRHSAGHQAPRGQGEGPADRRGGRGPGHQRPGVLTLDPGHTRHWILRI